VPSFKVFSPCPFYGAASPFCSTYTTTPSLISGAPVQSIESGCLHQLDIFGGSCNGCATSGKSKVQPHGVAFFIKCPQITHYSSVVHLLLPVVSACLHTLSVVIRFPERVQENHLREMQIIEEEYATLKEK